MTASMEVFFKEFKAKLQKQNPLTELLSLKQTGTVVEYHDQFVFLLANVELFKGYAISLFLNGLKNEIQPSVRLFKSKTIQQAFVLAHLQECTLKTLHQKSTTTLQEPITTFQEPPLQCTPTNLPRMQLKTFPIQQKIAQTHPSSFTGNNKPLNSTKIRSNTDFDGKRAKGLCLWCDDEYAPDHKCSQNKLFLVVVNEVEEEEDPSNETNAIVK